MSALACTQHLRFKTAAPLSLSRIPENVRLSIDELACIVMQVPKLTNETIEV
jgi:hypothetical protein